MPVSEFLQACARGDDAAVQRLLAEEPALALARDEQGRSGLHLATAHPDILRRLLAHGADPDAREGGDNVTPLHLAAANAHLESVRVLLDAGADVHGVGDLHEGDVIGWAAGSGRRDVVDLLVAHGARHHVFSALALRDHALLRHVVTSDPAALRRRRSRFENRHTAVHAAFAAPDGLGYLTGTPDLEALALLIELGADVHATDDRDRTPLDVALLRGNVAAVRLLEAAGARTSAGSGRPEVAEEMRRLAGAVSLGEPMFRVRDGRVTVRWYESIGFRLIDAFEAEGDLRFARLEYGACRFALSAGDQRADGVSLWVFTTAVADMYALVKARQLQAAQAAREDASVLQWPFDEDLHSPFYGGRQFSLRDPNGIVVVFYQPDVPG